MQPVYRNFPSFLCIFSIFSNSANLATRLVFVVVLPRLVFFAALVTFTCDSDYEREYFCKFFITKAPIVRNGTDAHTHMQMFAERLFSLVETFPSASFALFGQNLVANRLCVKGLRPFNKFAVLPTLFESFPIDCPQSQSPVFFYRRAF